MDRPERVRRLAQRVVELESALYAARGRADRERWLRELAAIHAELVALGREGADPELLDRQREALRALVNLGVDLGSLWEGQSLRRMSALTLILVVDALIAGIYGMNFVFIPSLDWQAGYPWALGLMVATSLALVVLFGRLRWL
jgi:CorA-like Mg2+ transporter protein